MSNQLQIDKLHNQPLVQKNKEILEEINVTCQRIDHLKYRIENIQSGFDNIRILKTILGLQKIRLEKLNNDLKEARSKLNII